VPVYLVRHAHAGSRASWAEDDDLRPLSPKGARQADALLNRLQDTAVGWVVSSPSRRCVETVEPIAHRLDMKIHTRKEFLEGADPDGALDLLFELAPRDPVVCSHGDLIPKMIRRMVGAGMRTKDANISQKGSLWVIEVEKGRPVKGKYHPPG
jgi:8-oxo-dGTP diphosphatase